MNRPVLFYGSKVAQGALTTFITPALGKLTSSIVGHDPATTLSQSMKNGVTSRQGTIILNLCCGVLAFFLMPFDGSLLAFLPPFGFVVVIWRTAGKLRFMCSGVQRVTKDRHFRKGDEDSLFDPDDFVKIMNGKNVEAKEVRRGEGGVRRGERCCSCDGNIPYT